MREGVLWWGGGGGWEKVREGGMGKGEGGRDGKR